MSYKSDTLKSEHSAEELIKKSLAAAKHHNQLGALIYLDSENAILKARKADESYTQKKHTNALHGVPIVVKDNIHVAGMPNSAGTAALKNFVPKTSNAVVSSLEAAGAVVIGKSNMHELALGITGNNSAFGPARNAHNPNLIGGGSSGGTAVAVAAGIVSMGLGTDTGGSTRVPAALNGVIGFRPTLGRYHSTDVTPLSNTRDTIGPIADSMRSITLMDNIITGEELVSAPADLQQLRIGVSREYFYANLSKDVKLNIEAVLSKLEKAGVTLVDVELPGLQALNDNISFPVALHELVTQLPEYLSRYETGLQMQDLVSQIKSPDVLSAVQSQLSEDAIPAEVYRQAIDVHRPNLKKLYSDAFESYNIDALIAPTTPCVAQAISSSDETVNVNGEQVPTFTTYIQNTDPSSNAGLPSISLPSGTSSEGLPMGVLVDGPEHSDQKIIEIALAIEALLQFNT